MYFLPFLTERQGLLLLLLAAEPLPLPSSGIPVPLPLPCSGIPVPRAGNAWCAGSYSRMQEAQVRRQRKSKRERYQSEQFTLSAHLKLPLGASQKYLTTHIFGCVPLKTACHKFPRAAAPLGSANSSVSSLAPSSSPEVISV